MAQRDRIARGVATLELVMCMPILLLLMIGIVWLGFSVIGQSQVTVQARHQAWQQRFDDGSSRALDFLGDDYASEEATTKIEISPLLDDVSPPSSSHDVAMGTWDHNKIDLNQAPSWELYVTAAVNAKTGGLQNAYEDARGMLQSLQQAATRQVAEEMMNVIREALENPLDGFKSGANDAERDNRDKAAQQKQQVQAEIREQEAELKRAEEQLEQLKQDKADADDESEKTSLTARIKVVGNKVKRLKTRLDRLKLDRDSMEG